MESCVRILIRRVTTSGVSFKELILPTTYWIGLGWKQEEQSESNVSSPWKRLQRAELSMGRKRRRNHRTKLLKRKDVCGGWSPGLWRGGLAELLLFELLGHVWLFCNPMDYSLPGSSVYGIFQERILEWVAISFSRESSRPRDLTHAFYLSCIGRWILYHWTIWEPTWLSSRAIYQDKWRSRIEWRGWA